MMHALSDQVDIPEIDRLLVQLEELSCTSPHVFAYEFAAKCFAGLVNKRPAGTQTVILSSFQILRPTFCATLPNGRLFLNQSASLEIMNELFEPWSLFT